MKPTHRKTALRALRDKLREARADLRTFRRHDWRAARVKRMEVRVTRLREAYEAIHAGGFEHEMRCAECNGTAQKEEKINDPRKS